MCYFIKFSSLSSLTEEKQPSHASYTLICFNDSVIGRLSDKRFLFLKNMDFLNYFLWTEVEGARMTHFHFGANEHIREALQNHG